MNFGTSDPAPAEAPVEGAPAQAVEQATAPKNDAVPTEAPDTDAGEEQFVDPAFEEELKSIYAQSDPEQSIAELRAEFGPQYDSYMHLASGFAQVPGFADAQRVLEVAGVVNHPAVTRFLMNAGRIHYTTAAEGGENTAPQTPDNSDDGFDDALETLRERQAEARGKGSNRKADALYREEMALIARRNGGGGIVNGRRTA